MKPTFPSSDEMFDQEDSEDLGETKSSLSKIDAPERVIDFLEELFGSCNLTIRDIGHSIIIDLGKCEIGRFCSEVGRCHAKNNTYLIYEKTTMKLFHKCRKCKHCKKLIKQFKTVDLSDLTDYKLAKLFVEQFGEEFIYDGDYIYYYNGRLWEKDISKKHIIHYFNKKLYRFCRDAYYDNDSEKDDKKLTTLKIILGIQQARKKEDIFLRKFVHSSHAMLSLTRSGN